MGIAASCRLGGLLRGSTLHAFAFSHEVVHCVMYAGILPHLYSMYCVNIEGAQLNNKATVTHSYVGCVGDFCCAKCVEYLHTISRLIKQEHVAWGTLFKQCWS